MRKLEDLFNLPPGPSITDSQDGIEDTHDYDDEIADNQLVIAETNRAIDKIDMALPTVRDLEASDLEMDELATLATDTFKNLIDLSMNVEARFSGPILQSASAMLGHAVTAKMAKMDKKLKMVDLQLKKARLDQQLTKANQGQGGASGDDPIEGEGVVMSRNDLLKSILSQSKESDK